MNLEAREYKVIGPNEQLGYFPHQKDLDTKKFPEVTTIEACEKDFKRVVGRFPKYAIRFLKQRLARGKINGCFHNTDLFGTLAKALKEKPSALCERIGHIRGLNNPAEHWFFQIGQRIIAGQKTYHRCVFTETAICWCDSLLRKRKRPKNMITAKRKPSRLKPG